MSSNTHQPPRRKWRGWLKSIIIFMIMFTVATTALETWRNRHLNQMQISATQPAFTTIDGQQINIFKDSYDQTVLVYVWATWCGSCKVVSPMINWLNNQPWLNTKIVTIAMRSGDDRRLHAYLNMKGYDFPVVNDNSNVLTHQWKLSRAPTILIIKKGKIQATTAGLVTPPGLLARLAWVDMK
ncbi:protein disulfide oxidoreductase [Photobacterium phosphoreum]|uniref:thioredoxin-like domain-containing protein n=1 Tax=Photobacterium phosphoreum TaxID=659 RepID=UPI000D17EAC1|nr:thioredoxin domain-containing protein [Photobacterium phosphoreum]PSU84793.1 protein disulfide oxidoreductase [Photobacterium phosphoreum]